MTVASRAEAMATICCECGKMRVGDVWMEVSGAAESAVCVSHGFCPACYDSAMLAAALAKVVSFRVRAEAR